MSSAIQRQEFASQIHALECRPDAAGRPRVNDLGGGSFEVSGISNRHHPAEAVRLRDLVRQGEFAAATRLAIAVIAEYTDPVEAWSAVPAVEAFLRDTAFERGRGGAAKVLQMAVRVTVDGAVGKVTLAAVKRAQRNPVALLKRLRTARDEYESSAEGKGKARVPAGQAARWDEMLRFCLSVSKRAGVAGASGRGGGAQVRRKAQKPAKPTARFRLDARPDTVDFRDRFFEPSLNEVPVELPLRRYVRWRNPVLDQGTEGACTGFALAAVANHLLIVRGDIVAGKLGAEGYVSPRMMYAMARRYDEWPGTDYEGSSARGAMKGWHKHGVCRAALWPHRPGASGDRFTQERAVDAGRIPLGAYLRINHLDLVALHSALAEVGILYATAGVHSGWDTVASDGLIQWDPKMEEVGGHAFVLVGYDSTGFWLQNSWGRRWGKRGYAHVGYDDWLAHASDVWVARVGAPVRLPERRNDGARAALRGSGMPAGYSHEELRPHVISLGRDGELRTDGQFATSPSHIAQLFDEIIPQKIRQWRHPRLMLYAHGGLNSESDAVDTLAGMLGRLLEREIFPIAFAWHTDALSTIKNILARAWESLGLAPPGRSGFFDALVERWDETLEVVVRGAGKPLWDEMKLNAIQATRNARGGARILGERLGAFLLNHPAVGVHLTGHSAGSILLAGLAQKLASRGAIPSGLLAGEDGYGHRIDALNLWAPACTAALFKDTLAPLLRNGQVARCHLFVLNDPTERADSAGPYRKSLLYLVSNAFETVPRTTHRGHGTPILGLKKFHDADAGLASVFVAPHAVFVAPEVPQTRSTSHGGFDTDRATLETTIDLIAG